MVDQELGKTKLFDQNDSKRKETSLFIFLTGIFLTNAIIAEIIGVKIFSLEDFLGIGKAQLEIIPGFILDFNLTSGVLIWPIVFITTDIVNEYFGIKGVRRISFLSAGLIGYLFLIISLATVLPPAQFWINNNLHDNVGNSFNINYAFKIIFRQGLGIIIGSLTAFLIGQLLDAFSFQWIKKFTGKKHIWLRATGSTLISQLVDSFVVLIVAFYIFGNWTFEQVIAVSIINYIYKFVAAVVLTPTLYVAHYFIDNFLGMEAADKLIEKASKDRSLF